MVSPKSSREALRMVITPQYSAVHSAARFVTTTGPSVDWVMDGVTE